MRVDSNVRIVGGQESSNNDAIGVYCAKDPVSGIASRCTVQNNRLIQGSGAGFPPRATGVQCDVGACALVEKNLITARGGQRTFGVVLNGAGTLVRKNQIEAGCATVEGVGLLSLDSFARVENNQVRGSVCPNTGMGPMFSPTSTAVKVIIGLGGSELDLHSNSVAPFGGRGAACVSRALTFEVMDAGAPAGPSGLVRNNVLHAGVCATARPVEELSAGADPRLFENNDLFTSADGGLYLDEGTLALPDVTAVNMLSGAAATMAADPQYDGGVHLAPTSPCRNAGTASGAPGDDFDGDARPQETTIDLGADEFIP